MFDTHIGDETEHTEIGDVESVPLADVVHKFKFIELILRGLRDVCRVNIQSTTRCWYVMHDLSIIGSCEVVSL